jgi:hypothetical protein
VLFKYKLMHINHNLWDAAYMIYFAKSDFNMYHHYSSLTSIINHRFFWIEMLCYDFLIFFHKNTKVFTILPFLLLKEKSSTSNILISKNKMRNWQKDLLILLLRVIFHEHTFLVFQFLTYDLIIIVLYQSWSY